MIPSLIHFLILVRLSRDDLRAGRGLLRFITTATLCSLLSPLVFSSTPAQQNQNTRWHYSLATASDAPMALVAISVEPASVTAQAGRDQSKLAIFVGVKGGRLVVDREKSKDGFTASDEFRRRLGSQMSDAEKSKTISVFLQTLFDDLDVKFSTLDKIYRYALDDKEKENEPNDPKTSKLSNFPGRAGVGSWEEFSEEFEKWVGETDRLPLTELFSTGEMLRDLGSIGKQTALIFLPTARPVPFNGRRGSLSFRVADPIEKGEYEIRFPNELDEKKAEAKRKTIIKLLNALDGKLWRGSQIKSIIEEYYAERGLLGVVNISAAGKPREIVIPEGARIARLLFHKDVPAKDLNKVAYLLLPDGPFRTFVKTHPLSPVTITDDKGKEVVAYQAVDFNDLGKAQGEEPFLNQYQLQIQQLELSQLGFVVSPQQTPDEVRDQSNDRSYVDIFVFKAEQEASGEKPDNVPETAVPSATDEGLVKAQQGGAAGSMTDFVPSLTNTATPAEEGEVAGDDSSDTDPTATPTPTPSPTPAPKASEPWQPEDKKNYIGFGIRYKPGQSVRFFGLLQRERLLSALDALSAQVGTQDGALGSFNYFSDFVAFDALGRRRLSLQITGQSEFNAARIFGGIETDERRIGGVVRAELELFRDLANSMLRVYAEARETTVHLIQDDHIASKQNLTTIDLGAVYLFEDRIAYRPQTLRLEPMLRIGLGVGADKPQFTSFLLTGNYHRRLPRSLEGDFTGRIALASQNTPIFELPSLGGVDVLRGFREDDALGRRIWSLQSELWMPLPGTSGAEGGIRQFLRRQVRLASFIDVGGAYLTTASTSGFRAGPGIGARIIYRPAIIKLDWAYGIGDAATSGRGRGRFYFSVGTNLPF
jgi:hypothetical protein